MDTLMTPNSPESVLALFTTKKESIAFFADAIINKVKGGTLNALQIKSLCKAMIETAELIDKGTREEQKNEADKYAAEKSFEAYGCKWEIAPIKTEYDYDQCNDPQLERLENIEWAAKEQVKQRKAFLQNLSAPIHIVDEESGELVQLQPPVKIQEMGVKSKLL